LIAYFDTSAIIPLLIDEPATERCRDLWLAADRLVGVRLAHVEAHAALAQATRTGRITDPDLRASLRALDALLAQVDLIEVDADVIGRAGPLAEAQGLRAYDAVHLAAAVAIGAEDLVVVAGDRALVAAAEAAGLMTAAVAG